ncbi:MAG: hypothetical protein IPM56_04950 [Ignavibacteriales bacterium]|nr:MAG: hypothetical protein IPM56_04950 [Ignavibacteriales bacterium]
MFEKEINFISDFSLNKVKKFGSFVTFEKILATDIHPAVKQYISAELDYLIFKDRNKLLQDSAFDYSGQEITKYFNLIALEIKKSKRISFEDMRTLITQAVSFNINFLIRPKWSLANLIFDNSKEHTVQEVVMMLNYIYYYEYLKDILNEYLEKRKVIIINLTEFELILNKLDRELFTSRANSLLENVLVSVAEFFNEGGVNKSKISPLSIETFLKEKNLMDHLVTLRKSVPAEDRQKYDISDLRKILFVEPVVKQESKQSVSDEDDHTLAEIEDGGDNILAEIDDEENSIQPVQEYESVSEINDVNGAGNSEKQNDFADTSVEAKNEPESENEEDLLSFYEAEIKALDDDGLFKGIDDDFDKESSKNEIIETMDEDVTIQKENSTTSENQYELESKNDEVIKDKLPEYEKIEFEEEIFTIDADDNDEDESRESIESANHTDNENGSTVQEVKTKTEKELFSFMSDKEMEKIVGTVFNDDREDFVTTLERISECNTYEEASEILKGVYFSYKVSPYSREALSLTNIVSSYFQQG